MPRIKWLSRAKLTTTALGLKSDVERASIPLMVSADEELEVSAAMLKIIEKIHPGLFEVVSKSEKADAGETPGKGKK